MRAVCLRWFAREGGEARVVDVEGGGVGRQEEVMGSGGGQEGWGIYLISVLTVRRCEVQKDRWCGDLDWGGTHPSAEIAILDTTRPLSAFAHFTRPSLPAENRYVPSWL